MLQETLVEGHPAAVALMSEHHETVEQSRSRAESDERAGDVPDSASLSEPTTKMEWIGTDTDSEALKDVDILIAFENYEQASEQINSLLDVGPDNPEYRLRLLHILSAGGEPEASKEQEEILETMMQDLLPGHPLFNTDHGGSTEVSADFDADAVFDVTAGTPTLTLATAQRDNDTTESPLAPPRGPVAVDDDPDHFIKAAFDGAGALDA